MNAAAVQPAPLTPAAVKQHEALVHQTEKWVAQSFYGTLLKQMRDDPFQSDLFSGGSGGKAFSAMFDQELAQRMSRGTASGLVNSIVQKIEGKKASASYLLQSKIAPQALHSASDAALEARSHVPPIG
jgi:Rod binding domain-containing protein